VRTLMWHVHGSYMTALVRGRHEFVLPVTPDRGPDGRGRALTWDWPPNAREVAPPQLRDESIDVVVLQRPHELALCEEWTGRKPGPDLPAVYLEHNAPQGTVNDMRHPVADRDDVLLVHVTHFNDLFWDAGSTPTTVVEHGIVDPGELYVGDLPCAVACINEPLRRARVTGTDLLARFAAHAPIDLFGIGSEAAGGLGNLAQEELHREMARRRVYLHPFRWTSLGLALIEAMHLGMPVVALATTEVAAAVSDDTGAVSTDVEELGTVLARLIADPEEARQRGKAARQYALGRYGLDRFLADWDVVLERARSGRG
jgi:Glycosyl transferases group 1